MTANHSNDARDHTKIPQLFLDAMAVREEVFVKEQGVPAENEIDKDEERSWHWIVYAGPNVEGDEGEGKADGVGGGRRARRLVPVGTVRLVPPPHHHHQQHPDFSSASASTSSTSSFPVSNPDISGSSPPSGNKQIGEPYVKLTRLAILGSYRRRGLAARLTQACLDWAAANAAEIDRAAQPNLTQRSDQGVEGPQYQKWQGLVRIHAQVSAVRWYEGQGFDLDKDEHGKVKGGWDEEGIPHMGMWKQIKL